MNKALFLKSDGPVWVKEGREFIWGNQYFDVEEEILVGGESFLICHQDNPESALMIGLEHTKQNKSVSHHKTFFCFYYFGTENPNFTIFPVFTLHQLKLSHGSELPGFSKRQIKPPSEV